MAIAIPIAMAALTVASGAREAQGQRASGRIAATEHDIAARTEGDAARQREIERKRNLMRAISSQVARAGAAGADASHGSLAAAMEFDIRQAREDSAVDTVNTQTRQRLLQARGANTREAGRAAARGTILDTATQAFDILGGVDFKKDKKAV
jgi:hypothetical protein